MPGLTVMRKKTATMTPDVVQSFASGCKVDLKQEHITPLIGTNCVIMLIRGEESQNVSILLANLVHN